MDLIDLKGSALKLYLVLVAQRGETGVCCLSQRCLSRLAGLARNTLAQALCQLERHCLVTAQEEGWAVDHAPLAALLGRHASGSKTEPLLPESGSKIEPVRVEGGSKTEPVSPPSGSKIEPPAPSSNAPARTLWSSSSEEDVLEKPPYSSPPEGGAGGDQTPEAFLQEMKAVWRAIAPQEHDEPRDWFHKLHREFGPHIPLTVLRQFALADRTLDQLRYPLSYKSYFIRCCRRACEEGEEAASLPEQSKASPGQGKPLTADDYDLRDFYEDDQTASWPPSN